MRKSIVLTLLAIPVFLGRAPASPDDPEITTSEVLEVSEISADGWRAIRKGLDWLARQQREDGSFVANVGYKRNYDYVVENANVGHVGITALAGMAFLAGGNVPGRGRYGPNVEKAVDYLLSCVNSDGMITANKSRMYSHAFGTLFLAEVYGMSRDARLKEALEAAVKFTWSSQNPVGGWRYAPFDRDSDMSITVCQVMALRAARNAGIRVPKESIDRAVNYVLMSANTDPGDENGSFEYQYRPNDPSPTRSTFALTAAGLATLYMAGLYTDEDVRKHIEQHRISRFLRRDPPPRIEPILKYLEETFDDRPGAFFFYYGHYYAVQAMFIAGGDRWDKYFRRVQDELVKHQNRSEGFWPVHSVGNVYSTAVACLILQVPYRYLPIFTR